MENFVKYDAPALAKVKKQALLWLAVLTQTPCKKLRSKIDSRVCLAVGNKVWSDRLKITLFEMGKVLRDLPKKDRFNFVYWSMSGNVPMLNKLLRKKKVPTFISILPGVDCRLNHWMSTRGEVASGQLIWLFMKVAFPKQIMSAEPD